MGLRIGSYLSQTTLFAHRQLGLHAKRAGLAYERLSSGRRINRAADGPAELAISEGLRAQIRSVSRARRNALDGVSIAQVGEGGLVETSHLLIRLRELAVQSANGSLGDKQRTSLGNEAEALLEEIDRIAGVTKFSWRTILDGNSGVQIATDAYGANLFVLPTVDATRAGLGLTGTDLGTDASTALAAFGEIDLAISQVAADRGRLGASVNVLESRIRQSFAEEENLTAAESRIVDADFAAETAELVKAQILEQTAISVIAAERLQAELILDLIESATKN